jgi:hypothetical protein
MPVSHKAGAASEAVAENASWARVDLLQVQARATHATEGAPWLGC